MRIIVMNLLGCMILQMACSHYEVWHDDSDPCAGVTCSGHGVCLARDGRPVCQCQEGFREHAGVFCALEERDGGECVGGGWCWANPLPQGGDAISIWGVADDDLWIGMNNGIVRHWDGRSWHSIELIASTVGVRVGSRGPKAPVFLTIAKAYNFDGRTVEAQPYDDYRSAIAAWGASPDDVWACSWEDGYHYDGLSWSQVPDLTCRALWGSSRENVWAVGPQGSIQRFDGKNWSRLGPEIGSDLSAIWGTAEDDVWVAGHGLWHWDGDGWQEFPDHGIEEGINAIGGNSSNNVWIAGDGGQLSRYDGTGWAVVDSGTDDNLNAIWGSSRGLVWIAGDNGALFTWDARASRLSSLTRKVLTTTGNMAIWGMDTGEIWLASGRTEVFRWDGRAWSRIPGLDNEYKIRDIWGSGPNDVWVVGSGGLAVHFDGVAWTHSDTDTYWALEGVWGTAPDNVWAVGWKGTILHWNGTAWTQVAYTNPNNLDCRFKDVFGFSDDDVWIAGKGNHDCVLHFDGQSWTNVSNHPDHGGLNSVWGTAPDDVWVLGWTAIHWDGAGWDQKIRFVLPVFEVFSTWGTGTNDVWAVGDTPHIHHFNGSEWTMLNGHRSDWRKIWFSRSGHGWIAGKNGALLRKLPR